MSSQDNTSKLRCVVFMGSVREGRLCDRVAKFMTKMLESRGFHVDLFDPLELNFPLLRKAVIHYQNPDDVPKYLQDCVHIVSQADAFVVLSAEYKHSIPPALSNMLDHFGGLPHFFFKPSAIVCYASGQYGGMRAAMQLRAFLGELGCTSVQRIFGIPHAREALDESGNPLNHHMEKGAKLLIDQLEWTAWAMKYHSERAGIPEIPPRGT